MPEITEVLKSTNPELVGKSLLVKLWHHCAALFLDTISIFQSPSVSHINFITNYTRFFSYIEIHKGSLNIAHPSGPMLT